TTIWVALFFLSTKKTFQIPSGLSTLIKKFGKEKGTNYIQKTNQWMEEICIMSRDNLRTPQAKRIFVYCFLFSIVSWIFYGISFMVIANGAGYVIDFFDSFMAVMAANAIGNLPITVGGSGLAEFGVIAYLNNLDPFNFEVAENTVEWNLIIAWRIATYYVPIGITWLLLVKFALSKYTKTRIP
ncbi:MAG: flippase-like domain-containing protein, partial [Thaumarchaeota archaeon]|nr:flippase-like domain-containing protein [Nitrososphaerota archaeon]